MAQYQVPDPDALFECPYDNTHMIAAKRMQYHLMRCRKNHPGKELSVCPFNARHEVPKPELRYHMSNCPDKARIEPLMSFENSKKAEGTYFKGNTDLPNYSPCDNWESSENWDEEIPSNPRIGIDPNYFNRLNCRSLVGMTNTEKKQYYSMIKLPPEERIVHPAEEQTADDDDEDDDKMLRMPHHKPHTYMNSMDRGGQQPSSVYAYSLSMSGVGRGQAVGRGRGSAVEEAKIQGRGRAAGRGSALKPGHQIINGYDKQLTTNASTFPGGSVSNSMLGQNVSGMPQYPSQVTNVFQMGIGRGRGITQAFLNKNQDTPPTFIVPTMNIPADKRMDEVRSNSRDSSLSSREGVSSSDTDTAPSTKEVNPEAVRARDMKRLQKKLRQIEILESKMKEGYKLTTEEEIKVENRLSIVTALENLKTS